MPFVRCQCCKGTGQIELTGIYAQTLELLSRQPGEMTGAALARIADCNATAMNNRLDRLERHGLVTSRRFGRKRLYRPVKGD